MSRRTPRRRISPRTVRRYRAIKNFVRRALGSSSQPDIKSNSSITVSVLDLRQKIDGIEQQLNTVSKHCQDLVTLESRFKLKNLNKHTDPERDTDTYTENNEVLHKISHDRRDKSVNNRSTPNVSLRSDDTCIDIKTLGSNKMLNGNCSYYYKEIRKNKLNHALDPIEENEKRLRRRKKHIDTKTLPSNLPMYGSRSFNETRNYTHAGYSDDRRHRNRKKTEYMDTNSRTMPLNNHTEQTCGVHKNHRNKYASPNLDQDFIADIIRRQYRPVKLFGRRESDFSQFSAPVCRDQEFSIRETIQEGSDLCSCCHEEHKKHRHTKYMCSNDLSDIRSICDTRLYSSKKHKHTSNHIKHTNEFYNDSAMYDIIPVKEKCSPKSRRKFVEDNMLFHNNYREVPPSPRTQRPRLNLQAQYQTEDDQDDICLERQLKNMKRLQQKSMMPKQGNFSNISSEVFIHNRNFNCMQNMQLSNNAKPYTEECVGTINNSQYPVLGNDQGMANNDVTLNTQTTDLSVDKTDKTLNEIKDILQNFLKEIKRESSQSEKVNNTPQSEAVTNTNETQQHIKPNSFNSSNIGHCGLPPFMQTLPNSCCYPLLPVCPINCMQNGFVLPSPSFTCAACANNSKEPTCGSIDIKNKTSSSQDANSETQKLIKEIHNLLSQNPNSNQKKEQCKTAELKPLTIKSTRDSSKLSKHDAKVGTTKLKCYSRSCEAIGSREATNMRYGTNVSYSDTVLEKGSGEETTTESVTESEYSSDPTVVDKTKQSKFKNILRSIGILKRNKTDVIEELTESESNADIVKPRPRSPFHSHPTSPYQQHIINYNMHGQEYYHPPMAPHHQHQYECCSHHDPRTCYSPTSMNGKTKNPQGRHYQEQDILTHCMSPIHNSPPMCANYYDPHYGHVSPQVPVCLKEIEVKSIGTQSVRKISLLEKLTNKMQVPVQQPKESSPKQSSTLTSSKEKNSKGKPEPSLFDWKKIHEKAMQKTTDPLKFSYKTQKKLAEGDNTMRKVMLKKLFYKRNPFSPRNLLVRTLLGKDPSSFGEPPKMYKPRMFL